MNTGAAIELHKVCSKRDVTAEEIREAIKEYGITVVEIRALATLLIRRHLEDEYYVAEIEDLNVDALISANWDVVFPVLLEYGLNPNGCSEVDTEPYYYMNIAFNVYSDRVSIAMLKALLEHGGNPNIKDIDTAVGLFTRVNKYINREHALAEIADGITMQKWLLLLAYGGRDKKDSREVQLQNGYTLEDFKEPNHYIFEFDIEGRLSIFDTLNGKLAATK